MPSSDPVMALPSELVMEIFKLCPTWTITEGILLEKDEFYEFYEWTAIAFVSRRWREIAVGAPTLWTDILLNDEHCRIPPWLLARSQDLPLNIAFSCYEVPHTAGFMSVAAEMWPGIVEISPRIQHLDIEFTVDVRVPIRHAVWEKFLDNLEKPVLYQLKFLRLASNHMEYVDSFFDAVIPDGSSLPALKTLIGCRLTSFEVLSRLFGPHMKHLSIIDFAYDFPHDNYEWAPFLDAMSTLTGLEALHVEQPPIDFTDVSNSATLPALRRFSLASEHNPVSQLSQLLDHLTFSPHYLSFALGAGTLFCGPESHSYYDGLEDTIQLGRILQPRLASPYIPTTRFLALEIRRHSRSLVRTNLTNFTILGWSTDPNVAGDSGQTLNLRIRCRYTPHHILEHVVGSLPLEHIESLKVSFPEHQALLFDEVEQDPPLPGVFAIGRGSPRFPNLRILELSDVEFAFEDTHGAEYSSLLERELQARARAGMRIHTLRLRNPHSYDNSLADRFRVLVDELVRLEP